MPDFPAGLRQPDQRSCGAACLVAAQGLRDADYRARVADPATFRSEVLAMHARVTSPVDVARRLQPPWPRSLGTPPWAVARQLAGTTGVEHRSAPVRWRDTADSYDAVVDRVGPARPVPVYVGNGWLPRHVVLVLGGAAEGLRVYEPSSGAAVEVSRTRFVGRRLGLAGWDVAWFTVLPDG